VALNDNSTDVYSDYSELQLDKFDNFVPNSPNPVEVVDDSNFSSADAVKFADFVKIDFGVD
jgi:hypothetical protein